MLPIAILAGGLATRLGPLAASLPKSLTDIAGEPFLGRQLRLLKRGGIERVILCAGHLGEQIRDYAGDGHAFGMDIEYSFDGPQPLGTAGAIRAALPLLGSRFFVIYGDSYLPCDYRAVERAFLDSGKLALMTVFANENRWDRSNVEYSGGIIAYDKRRPTARMRHIDYGLEAFHEAAFLALPDGQPCDLAAVCQDLLHRGQLAGYEVPQRFYEVGSPEGIRELTGHIQSQRVLKGAQDS